MVQVGLDCSTNCKVAFGAQAGPQTPRAGMRTGGPTAEVAAGEALARQRGGLRVEAGGSSLALDVASLADLASFVVKPCSSTFLIKQTQKGASSDCKPIHANLWRGSMQLLCIPILL